MSSAGAARSSRWGPGIVSSPPLPAHELFTPIGLSQYLDSGAGQALVAAHRGDRNAAAAALGAQAREAQAWRREQAQQLFERSPERYPGGVSEALARVGPPPGGAGVTLSGTSAEIEALSRRVDPVVPGFRVIAPEAPDNRVKVGTRFDDFGHVIDEPDMTLPPWRREG